jgi:gas vesicle protein
MNDMRRFLNIMESVEYEYSADKVIARLKSYDSQTYTKLAQKVERMSELSEELNRLKKEVRQETRDNIAALFEASDATRTRVVETVSFIFTLSKDPKPTETPKYKDILAEIERFMTPELIRVLEGLKSTMFSVTQKEASLKIKPVDDQDLKESVSDNIERLSQEVLEKTSSWAEAYDKRLQELKAKAGV